MADVERSGIESLGWFCVLDRRFYATSFPTGEVVSIDLAGEYDKVMPEASFEAPNGIAAGFEGNGLWVTEVHTGTLTRLSRDDSGNFVSPKVP